MKITMDETMKHRVVGIAVIISIALVFLPAMIKKNNQRLEEEKIALDFPVKPPPPKITEIDEHKVFAETKISHVDLNTQATLNQAEKKLILRPISAPKSIKKVSQIENPLSEKKTPLHTIKKGVLGKENHTKKIKTRPVNNIEKKPLVNANVQKSRLKAKVTASSLRQYSVQVGVFFKKENAQILQKKLIREGYKPRLFETTVHGKRAVKVLIGNLASIENANKLKIKLAKEQKLQGFVINGIG